MPARTPVPFLTDIAAVGRRPTLMAVRRHAKRDSGPAASIAAVYCAWHAALFSRARSSSESWLLRAWAACPYQARKADSCSARPYEKLNCQGCGASRFIASRLAVASSGVWPPDKKLTLGKRRLIRVDARRSNRDGLQGGFCSKYRDICKKTNAADRPIRVIARRDELIRASLATAAGTVRRRIWIVW